MPKYEHLSVILPSKKRNHESHGYFGSQFSQFLVLETTTVLICCTEEPGMDGDFTLITEKAMKT